MAPTTKVQLRLGERVIAEVPFGGDALRIGRMKENDLVINNLAVSRFHAVLRRVGGAFEVEDLGSENGTFVDGVRVAGAVPVAEGAELGVGKHTLVIASGDSAVAPPRAAGRSDAWDAGQTYFAPALAPRAAAPEPMPPEEGEELVAMVEAVEEAGEGPSHDGASVAAPLERAAHHAPDPDGLFAFGEEEIPFTESAAPLPDAAVFDVSAPDESPPVVPPELGGEPGPGGTGPFDFGAADDLGAADPSLAAPVAETPAASGHAGLIVSLGSRVEQVLPLRGDELVVGRGPSCDLVLRSSGVSRRHARFAREAGRYRVLDLGSANGISVNGTRVREHELEAGDIVAIDDYTLTFVIDSEPIEGTVRARLAPAGLPASEETGVVAPPEWDEQDVLLAADDEAGPLDLDKELERVEAASVALRACDASPGAAWVVELVVAPEAIPPVLRATLEALGDEALRLPVELKLRRR